MSRTISYSLEIIFYSAAALLGTALSASGQAIPVQREVREVHHDVSPAVLNMPKATSFRAVRREAVPLHRIPLPPGLKPAALPDSVLQIPSARLASTLLPPISRSFPGIGQGAYGFNIASQPPDMNGAAGQTQYMQWANDAFAVFDKSTGVLIAGPTDGSALWAGFGGLCESAGTGDGVVVYDRVANRWVVSQMAFKIDAKDHPIPPYFECVAVSTTPDATGTYNRYSFDFGTDFNDYPKMSVWPDAYYITYNIFPNNGDFTRGESCAYDRNAMINSQSTTPICFFTADQGGLLASDLDGKTTPPPGSPDYIVQFGSNVLNLWKFHPDFTDPKNSTFTGPTVIPVASFSALCDGGVCVPQRNVTQQLDSLGFTLMNRLAYRNFGSHESLVVNHSVAEGNAGGIRWYEIQNPNGTPLIAQQSTFAPDSNYRWIGSIAMDHAGDIALGYSKSSNLMFPSIAFTGRSPGDPPSTMEAESTVINGTGSQTNTPTAKFGERWGDYSAMQVDPVDDCTFWYTQEYYKTSGDFKWSTQIVSFKFPNCSTTSWSQSPSLGGLSHGLASKHRLK